jgi:hypothetical protein
LLVGSIRDASKLSGSIDEQNLAFISTVAGASQLSTLKADGSEMNTITTDGAKYFSWGPNAQIVYVNSTSKAAQDVGELWIMDKDGKNRKQLTYNKNP